MSTEQNLRTTVAAIKIAHIALFGNLPAKAEDGLVAIKECREDWANVLRYAEALSSNEVPDYYVKLPAQLKAVIFEWDLIRLLTNN